MKTGPLLGWLGCLLWMLNIAISSKAEWISLTVGIAAITLLVVGTIITGARKGRIRLGIGLSLLAVVFGLGFLIMILVPGKDSNDAAK